MTESEKNQEEQIYEILVSQFADARHRTEYLSDKAHSLLGFDGVINSILVALVILIVKDQSTREFVSSSKYLVYIDSFLLLGFSCYILSTMFALLSFRVAKYKRAPSIESVEFIQEVHEGTAKLSLTHMSIQILDAIRFTDGINKRKYDFLLIATVLLLIAITCTAVIGILVFISVA